MLRNPLALCPQSRQDCQEAEFLKTAPSNFWPHAGLVPEAFNLKELTSLNPERHSPEQAALRHQWGVSLGATIPNLLSKCVWPHRVIVTARPGPLRQVRKSKCSEMHVPSYTQSFYATDIFQQTLGAFWTSILHHWFFFSLLYVLLGQDLDLINEASFLFIL